MTIIVWLKNKLFTYFALLLELSYQWEVEIIYLIFNVSKQNILYRCLLSNTGFPDGSAGKETTCYARDLGSIPGLGTSLGEGKGYPLQYSGLENSMDCIVRVVAKSQTQLSDFHFHFLSNTRCETIVTHISFHFSTPSSMYCSSKKQYWIFLFPEVEMLIRNDNVSIK